MSEDNPAKIKIGDYIIIQRQQYTKLHKFGCLDSTAMLGKEQLILRNINDQNFFTTFKMIPKDSKGKRVSTLEVCTETEMGNIRDILGIEVSGKDNRNIIDDGDSQILKSEDIDKLKSECDGSSQILEKIVENSKTFHAKTQYSQEKYLKKKEKKYFEYVQIRKPTIRLLTEIYYRQDSDKIMGIRMDSLSQIISYSGVCGFGNFLLYESGSNGLLPAAFLNSMGAGTSAKLVHLHPGNVPQKQAIYALNLSEEHTDRCISVNIYSVLRQFYRNLEIQKDSIETNDICMGEEKSEDIPTEKNVVSNDNENKDGPIIKKLKLDETVVDDETEPLTKQTSHHKWQLENKAACEILNEKFDSLVIVAKEHPSNIIKALLPFIKPSRPIVLFSLYKELLSEMYVELKASNNVTGLHLTSNWLRKIQILPNRTHPEVNMNASSGSILTGYTIQ